jgi:hypothetical protein
MRLLHLAVLILQQHRVAAVENARTPRAQRCGILTEPGAAPARLDADDLHRRIPDEGMEDADGIRAAADAGDQHIRKRARFGKHLGTRLAADDGLQLSHEIGVGMRPDSRAEQIISVQWIGHPVPQRLIDRRAQGAVTAGDRNHLCTKQIHAADVRRLTFHVDVAHVHDTRQAQPRTGRRARHAVLAGPCLCNDTLRAELLCQQRLAEGRIDLVRAGVRQVFPLQPHLRAPALRELRREGQRGRAPDPALQVIRELLLEFGLGQVLADAALEALEGGDQRFRYVASAEGAEAATRIGEATGNLVRQQPLAVELG